MHESFRTYLQESLTNQPSSIDIWIHLLNCPRCRRDLEALREVSDLLYRDELVVPEQDPLFYERVQTRIAHLRARSPWRVLLYTGPAKRLILVCLVCTGLIAVYFLNVNSEEQSAAAMRHSTDVLNVEAIDRQAQRDAVLVNFVVDSKPVNETNR